jgi:hypothetical protein
LPSSLECPSTASKPETEHLSVLVRRIKRPSRLVSLLCRVLGCKWIFRLCVSRFGPTASGRALPSSVDRTEPWLFAGCIRAPVKTCISCILCTSSAAHYNAPNVWLSSTCDKSRVPGCFRNLARPGFAFQATTCFGSLSPMKACLLVRWIGQNRQDST